jgi:hypothetical protein
VDHDRRAVPGGANVELDAIDARPEERGRERFEAVLIGP